MRFEGLPSYTWNLDLTNYQGTEELRSLYIEGSLNRGSFSYYNFIGAENFT